MFILTGLADVLMAIAAVLAMVLAWVGIPGLTVFLLMPRFKPIEVPEKIYKDDLEPVEPGEDPVDEISELPEAPLPFESLRKSRKRHVLDKYTELLNGKVDCAIKMAVVSEGATVKVAGVVIGKREMPSKSGTMATFVIEDPSGRAECIIYAMTYLAHPVLEDQIVVVNGKVANSKLLVNGIEVLGKRRRRSKKVSTASKSKVPKGTDVQVAQQDVQSEADGSWLDEVKTN